VSVLPGRGAVRPVPTEGALALVGSPAAREGHPPLQAVPPRPRPRETPRKAGERAREGYALSGPVGAAYDDLHHALLLAKERRQEVPCRGSEGALWTSDVPADQAHAADRCLDCPAMLLCNRYADLAGEEFGTWGGVTRDPRGARRQARVEPARFPSERAKRRRWNPGQRDCTCGCGGTTKGGHYLPGHDSQHLSRLLARVRSGALRFDAALAEVAHSPRLQAKLAGR